MSNQVQVENGYTIQEAARLTGLPESTLRYYENIGIIAPIQRDRRSKHRVYSEDDLNILTSIACLSATGMSIVDMRTYISNRERGAQAAAEQIQLLQKQKDHLAVEAEHIKVRQKYVGLKIDYWHAVANGQAERAELIASESRKLIKNLR